MGWPACLTACLFTPRDGGIFVLIFAGGRSDTWLLFLLVTHGIASFSVSFLFFFDTCYCHKHVMALLVCLLACIALAVAGGGNLEFVLEGAGH